MNQNIKIPYKNKRLRINLILGIVWVLLGIVQIWTSDKISWNEYFWLFFGTFYLVTYFYQKKEKYITIENGIIKENWPFGKAVLLSEIKMIRHFAGDFIIKSADKRLVINIDLIDKESLAQLKEILKSLDAKWF